MKEFFFLENNVSGKILACPVFIISMADFIILDLYVLGKIQSRKIGKGRNIHKET